MSRWGENIHHIELLWRLREIVHKANRDNVDCCNPGTSYVAEKTEAWGNWETLFTHLHEESLTPISASLTSDFYSVSSVAKSCPTLCDPTDCSTLGFPVLHYLLEFAQIHFHWVGDAIQHLILCSPLLLLPSIFSSIRVFSNELSLPIRWPKYWSFSISSSNGNSGLISFSTYWLNLFAVQGTLKSLLQHHRSKASILQWSAIFMVQLSQLYMTTGKTIALTR